MFLTIAIILGGSSLINVKSELNNRTVAQAQGLKLNSPRKLPKITQQELNEQSLMSIGWVQYSGEYHALTYQAFNLARIAFDNAIAHGITNPTVVVDIDETILDNTPYQAALIDSNLNFTPGSWNQWVKTAKAHAIPGAIEFVNYVSSNGGKVFFVSNRAESSTNNRSYNDLELATIANLKAVGVIDVDDNNVLLKGEFSKKVAGRIDTNKKFRREAIKQGLTDGIARNIVVLVGDNLNDLGDRFGITNLQRRRSVGRDFHRYGAIQPKIEEPAYILIPNPIYGDWEAGIYNPSAFNKKRWHELTASEKNWQRKKLLRRWQVR